MDLQDVSQDLSQGALPLFHHRFLLLILICTLLTPPPQPRRAFANFFPGATPPFIPTTGTPAPSSSSSVNSVNPKMPQQDTGTISQGPTSEMIQGWKEEFMVDMKSYWQQFVGDSLRQLSPSDDREASWAQRKAGSKRADSGVRKRSRSSERSSADRHRARVRRHQMSLTPPPRPDACLLPPSAHGGTSVTSPVIPVPQKVVSVLHGPAVLGDLAHRFHAVVVLRLHLHLTAGPGIARLPLIGLSGPAWLGGLLGVHPCRHTDDHLLLIGGHDDHLGATSHPHCPRPGPLIVVHPYRPPGYLHPKDVGPVACLRGQWRPASRQPPSTWFPCTRPITTCGWLSVVSWDSAETLCRSVRSSGTFALRWSFAR